MRLEVVVKDDDGKVLGEYYAQNIVPASTVTVTATLWKDGTPAVSDDGGNTYYRWTEN